METIDLFDYGAPGGSADLKLDSSGATDNWQPLMQLPTADCGGRKARPVVVTLTLGVGAPLADAYAAGADSKVQARITWGSPGGGQQEATFDVKHGQRVTIECSSVDVAARYIGTVGPSVLTVRASVGRGSSSRTEPLSVTGDRTLLAVGIPTAAIRIPRFAQKLRVMSDWDPFAAPGAQITASFMASPVGAILYRGAVDPGAEIDILNGAEFVVFVGRHVQNITPYFVLAL